MRIARRIFNCWRGRDCLWDSHRRRVGDIQKKGQSGVKHRTPKARAAGGVVVPIDVIWLGPNAAMCSERRAAAAGGTRAHWGARGRVESSKVSRSLHRCIVAFIACNACNARNAMQCRPIGVDATMQRATRPMAATVSAGAGARVGTAACGVRRREELGASAANQIVLESGRLAFVCETRRLWGSLDEPGSGGVTRGAAM
jgi:hypothetical protein